VGKNASRGGIVGRKVTSVQENKVESIPEPKAPASIRNVESALSIRKTRSIRRVDVIPTPKLKPRPRPAPAPRTLRTNRRGLFTWDRWDGKPWESEKSMSYRLTQFFRDSDVVDQQYRVYRKNQKSTTLIRQFWRGHYRSLKLADQSLKSFQLLSVDTWIINFLLRTGPERFAGRFLSTVNALDILEMSKQGDMHVLRQIRRILAHHTSNPLYFEAMVQRYRISSAVISHRSSEVLADKEFRTQKKAVTGVLDIGIRNVRNLRPTRHSGIVPTIDNLTLDEFINASPPRWTIEPLSSFLSFSLRRWSAPLAELEIAAKVISPNPRLYNRIRETIIQIRTSASAIADLRSAFVALRYFRLEQFPDSFTKKEIELGKSLLTYLKREFISNDADDRTKNRSVGRPKRPAVKHLQLRASAPRKARRALSYSQFEGNLVPGRASLAQSSRSLVRFSSPPLKEYGLDAARRISQTTKLLVNRRGLFSWDRWDGQDWTTDTLRLYKQNVITHNANAAQTGLREVESRLCYTASRQVDAFLLAHHQSEWHVCHKLSPILRLLCDTTVISFLLRTSPKRIAQSFVHHWEILDTFTMDIQYELEQLRRLQITLAQLPHNPLLFELHAMGGIREAQAQSLFQEIKWDEKRIRSQRKASAGLFDFRAMRRTAEEKSSLTKKYRALNKLKGDMQMSRESMNIAALLWRTIFIITNALKKIGKEVTDLRPLSNQLLGRQRWWPVYAVLSAQAENVAGIASLSHELVALRCFRIHHYSERVSPKELAREQTFLNHIVSANKSSRSSGRSKRAGDSRLATRRDSRPRSLHSTMATPDKSTQAQGSWGNRSLQRSPKPSLRIIKVTSDYDVDSSGRQSQSWSSTTERILSILGQPQPRSPPKIALNDYDNMLKARTDMRKQTRANRPREDALGSVDSRAASSDGLGFPTKPLSKAAKRKKKRKALWTNMAAARESEAQEDSLSRWLRLDREAGGMDDWDEVIDVSGPEAMARDKDLR
jgi:hypothetical protein